MVKAAIYRKNIAHANYNCPDVQNRIQEACEALRSGAVPTVRAAADKYDLNYHTLWQRYNKGRQSVKEAHEKDKLLDRAQEEVMVEWMMFLSMVGRPICKATVRPKVYQLCGQVPGKTWIHRFLKRHPELKLGRPSGLDPKRAQAFNFKTVEDCFQRLKKVLADNNIPWENVYNMDEKGIQLGGGRRGSREKYFCPRSGRAHYKIRSAALELVTVIESCCADGSAFLPGFVFPGKSVDPENLEVDDNICVATSENGWTSDSLCTQWFEKSFIPQAKERNISGKPILLVFDGHGSHVTDRMISLAIENNIELFCLPPHTTHKLQPLDVGVFGPLQHAWTRQCDRYVAETGQGLQKRHVVREYMAARKNVFSKETILHAWKNCGFRPLNFEIFTATDYAPSRNSSVHAETPSSYPVEPPSDFDIPEDALNDIDVMGVENHGMGEEGFGESSNGSDSDSSDSDSNDGEDGGNSQGVGGANEDAVNGHMARQTRTQHCEQSSSAQTMSSVTEFGTSSQESTQPHIQTKSAASKLLDDLVKPFPASISRRDAIEKSRHIQTELINVRYDRNRIRAHSILMREEIANYKQQLNSKATKKKRSGLRVEAEVLTSVEARARRDAQNAEKAAKEHEKAARGARKAAKVAEVEARRAQMGSNHTFTGRLSANRSKTDLEDIAIALKISKDGTKADILTRIQDFFEANSELKTTDQFAGLFNRGSTQRRTAQNSENVPPSAGPSTMQIPHTYPDSSVLGPSRHHPQYSATCYTPYTIPFMSTFTQNAPAPSTLYNSIP